MIHNACLTGDTKLDEPDADPVDASCPSGDRDETVPMEQDSLLDNFVEDADSNDVDPNDVMDTL